MGEHLPNVLFMQTIIIFSNSIIKRLFIVSSCTFDYFVRLPCATKASTMVNFFDRSLDLFQ